jgi:mannose-1-phosphate guanylyltransferase/mannose-6-phosphate isomerase
MRTRALPLWWTSGADHRHGGFHDRLTAECQPSGGVRRARVQARQGYVYATALALGWEGPWREASEHALSWLFDHHLRSDGLYRTLLAVDGTPIDETAMLYDQSFVLLALAAAYAASPTRDDLRLRGHALAASLAALRWPGGGFRENGEHPFQANAHMHLLEACLAWIAIDDDAIWRNLADEIVELCRSRFLDPQGGFIREYFDSSWVPLQGADNDFYEPGHQFEWASLLYQWGEAGRGDARVVLPGLCRAGWAGVDPSRSVAVNRMRPSGMVADGSARLWPQTERARTAHLFGDAPEFVDADRGLWSYLDAPAPGLWRDRLGPDGGFVEEAAPASSLYHLMTLVVTRRSARSTPIGRG